MNYLELVREYGEVRSEVKRLIDLFPGGVREKILFDKWNLKDVIAHLSGWDIYDTMAVKALLEGREPEWGGGVDEFNRTSTEKRKDWSFEEVYAEFISVGEELIRVSLDLPEECWEKKFWQNREYTPKSMLEIDIEHYRKEHLGELKGKLGLVQTGSDEGGFGL